jgi:hypothetical protein
MAQPAATAGPILQVPIAIAEFHRSDQQAGPTRWRITSSRP